MDRLRSAFNGVMKSERYSRFTLQPAEDGERHAEVKLSDVAAGDGGELEAPGSPSFRPAPRGRGRATIGLLGALFLVALLLGYMIGYISHRTPRPEPDGCVGGATDPKGPVTTTTVTTTTPGPAPPAPELQLDWKDVTRLLSEKLSGEAFEETLSLLDRPARLAGGPEDVALGNRVFASFRDLDLDPWTDAHFLQLPAPDSLKPNRVQMRSLVFEPAGYLAYSATGRAQGPLVYGNYGRREDLDSVGEKGVELKGAVLLLRTGKISPAEKVDLASSRGAVAVLIYPDPQDRDFVRDTALYGHVHLGSGDPFTPGFPAFNHTQFPPTRSSGLPAVPAQTLTANMAAALLQQIGGPPPASGFRGALPSVSYSLGGQENVSVEVNNQPVSREIQNVFGVIRGFTDPDRFVLLGAQRDSWGPGYAKAAVGTAVLLELAKAVHQMVEQDGFRPRRSLVFASWSAGEYGSVGATEWLEAHMASIDRNVFTYISLDGLVLGRGGFEASASPLLYSLIQSTMKEVESPFGSGTLYNTMGRQDWETKVMRPMSMDDPAYPFLAFSGIPSVSFHFISPNMESYPYYGTSLDNRDHLNYQTNQGTGKMAAAAARFAGQMALRLVHDHLLSLDVSRYSRVLQGAVTPVYKYIKMNPQLKDLSPDWLSRARGSFNRAADGITVAIGNTDLNDPEACRILNDRMMRVERCFLSPYVSPVQTPFRHLLLGRGDHTLPSVALTSDPQQLRLRLALATWNLQGCANAMAGSLWEVDNLI
ncbi:transferrin receptor 1b [Menidia menidia]